MDQSLNFIENGVLMGLPAGYRFEPTDEELVLHYLHNKVMSLPLPANIIPDFEVYKSDTWDLPGNSETKRYFFSLNETSYPNGHIPNSSGYWKPAGIERPIVVSKGNEIIVGMKKTLVFYRGKSPNGFQTNWIMHEFRLPAYAAADGSIVNPNKKIILSESPDDAAVAMDKYWVLSKVFRKKNERKKAVRSSFFSDRNAAPASSDEPDRQEEISISTKKP